jgi:hypothetical protein
MTWMMPGRTFFVVVSLLGDPRMCQLDQEDVAFREPVLQARRRVEPELTSTEPQCSHTVSINQPYTIHQPQRQTCRSVGR